MLTNVKSSLLDLQNEIKRHGDPKRAENSERYFKTAPGQYGYGDVFLGLSNPISRQIAKNYQLLSLAEAEELLHSPIHEHRLIALLILIHQFQKGDLSNQRTIYNLYLKSTKYINNWDLVDLSASQIIGEYLVEHNRDILIKLSNSKLLWDRRIAIIATAAFIKRGESKNTFQVAQILLTDTHDLIHKAVGWMLREVGKFCGRDVEESFLQKHYSQMPRTMLRYAIERFPENLRTKYLRGQI